MASDATRTALQGHVDALGAEAVTFLRELVQTPSVNPPGRYEAVVDVVRSHYERYGWDVETVQAPDEVLDALGLDAPRPNVLAWVTRGDGPTIALNAHLDTVPVEEATWSYDPFGAQVDDGRLYGRGARDSKGRIASYTLAARALEASDCLPEDASVVLALTVDEETGGDAGAGFLVDSGVLRPDYAVVEGSIDAVEYASSGILTFAVTVDGVSAHAGIEPESGANAVVGAARVVTELDAYDRRLSQQVSEVPGVGAPSCTSAMIDGGVQTNVVPPSCTVTVDRRVPPEGDVDAAARAFREQVAVVDLPAGTSVTVERIACTPPFYSDPDAVHVRAVERNAEAVLGDVAVRGTGGGSDAGHFAAGGTAPLKFGPGDEDSNVHGPDENVSLQQVRDAAIVVAASVVDVGHEGSAPSTGS